MFRNLINRFFHKLAYVIPGGSSLRPWIHRMRGAKIGKNVWISQFVYIDELHPEAVTIHDNCTIGLRTSVFTHFYWGPRPTKYSWEKIGEKTVSV
jgi:acetyltransferase-like isoleucine patch superfamily enzyme